MKRKFRFHALGLPHTITNSEFSACAYTQKVLKFCKMMTDAGHVVIHYGHEDSDLQCTEHVPVITNKVWEETYGTHDYKSKMFKFSTDDAAYQHFYKNAIEEVGKRKQKNDFILPFWGHGVKPICEAHPDLITVEPGIGYSYGSWAQYKIFESYALYHAWCGLESAGTCQQNNYEVVIPNYFDLDDFNATQEKEDYFLFVGRVYDGKGVNIAMQVCEHLGLKLKVAGQLAPEYENYNWPDYVDFVGYVNIEQRKELMAKAKGSFIASQYVEPFGGVQIENLLSGTPTITSDWGAFTENNINGVTGYRCRTFDDYLKAAKNINEGVISSKTCREYGEKFSLENVAKMYEKYFNDVLNIFENGGWYQTDIPKVDNIEVVEADELEAPGWVGRV
jgi:glycosyltransferase involved in cell wall biosynthesis